MNKIYLILIASTLSVTINAQTALTFDGVDDYVEFASSAAVAISGDITVETKVKTNTNQVEYPLATNISEDASSFYQGYWLGVDTLGYAMWYLGDVSAIESAYSVLGTSLINDGNWHHISGVVTNANGANPTAMLYVDGILEATLSVPNLNLLSNDPFYIGADYWDSYHSGDIDDVRVWNRALNANEINQYKNACLIGTENGLAAFYDFEWGAGASDVFDMSINGNNGTMWAMDDNLSWVTGFNCVVTSVTEETFQSKINLYPNPSAGLINLELNDLKNVKIEVRNVHGKLIYSAENINTNNYQFELKGAAGIYFLEINSQDKRQQLKLIKN